MLSEKNRLEGCQLKLVITKLSSVFLPGNIYIPGEKMHTFHLFLSEGTSCDSS